MTTFATNLEDALAIIDIEAQIFEAAYEDEFTHEVLVDDEALCDVVAEMLEGDPDLEVTTDEEEDIFAEAVDNAVWATMNDMVDRGYARPYTYGSWLLVEETEAAKAEAEAEAQYRRDIDAAWEARN